MRGYIVAFLKSKWLLV